MNEDELAIVLRNIYINAKRKEIALQIHLFGIDYGYEIKRNQHNIRKIVERAGIEKGYIAEVSKGVKLSEYVERKNTKR